MRFKFVLYFFIFIFILAPMLTFFHELGHAINPLLQGLIVSIKIGEGFSVQKIIGNLSIEIGLLKPWLGYTSWSGAHKAELFSLILGPLFSFLFTLFLFFLGFLKRKKSYSILLFASAGFCFFQFLFTALPMTYPGFLIHGLEKVSDGKQILKKLNQ